MKNGQKKFLRARNIILIILMIGCIGGCTIFANKQKKAETENLELLNSLPELTTTAQILEAINAPQEKTYVINNYQFPRFTTVGDPYNYLTDSYYLRLCISLRGWQRWEKPRKTKPQTRSLRQTVFQREHRAARIQERNRKRSRLFAEEIAWRIRLLLQQTGDKRETFFRGDIGKPHRKSLRT